MSVETERFYGRRRGKKLRPRPQRLVDALLPELLFRPEDAAVGLWLEIGFGGGEHLAWQAERHPEVRMVGCEPYLNGVAKLLGLIEEKKLGNIRIHPHDARPLLDALPEASVARLFILFPDPWHKKRHAGRRFVGPANLPRLARVLRPGGELRVASDDAPLVAWMLHYLRRDGRFRWQVESCADWGQRPADWPPTRYEQKELHGKPVFLRFTRSETESFGHAAAAAQGGVAEQTEAQAYIGDAVKIIGRCCGNGESARGEHHVRRWQTVECRPLQPV